ncbi:telomere length regulation protein TEL2 homolog isoform 2-T2 [Leptodactylus fuscus]|uniref:telomere length regulation protein TEL2 homolog isoform X2 n=1 Tax=Leptodactylus fuscus TaxID=238119 RepID=UPI003F4F031E
MDGAAVSVRRDLRDIITELAEVADADRLLEVLSRARRYFGGGENPPSAQEIAEFNKFHYTPLLRTLLANMGPQWCDLLTAERLDLWDNYFLEGPADQAFLVLLDSLVSKPCLRLDRCVHVLEKFLQRGALARIIWEVCRQQLEAKPTPILHETLLTRICNFPDHTANCLQKQNKSLFYPKNYYPLVGKAILHVLHMVSASLREGKGCSISFISQLLGKVGILRRHRELYSALLPRLTELVQSDCIFQRMCWRMFESVPDRWLEPVVVGVVEMVNGPVILSHLIGDLVLKNRKVEFIFCQKLMFLQYGHKKETMICVLGYMAMSLSRRPMLVKILKTLLEVWSSDGVVRHSAHPLLHHISRSIFICLSLLSKEEVHTCKQEVLLALTSGTPLYLESSLPSVRFLGMVVAERLSKYIDAGGSSLSFEYEETGEIKELKSLISPYVIEAMSPVKGLDPSQSSQCSAEPYEEGEQKEPKPDPCSDSDLDSDDDLTPYDMSGDTELKKSKVPAYIRDAIEALMSEDLEKLEVTMSSMSGLIRSNPSATKEVSTELVKILLHLDERPGVENFIALRYSAMVSVTVIDPVPVLATAAQELAESANPEKAETPETAASPDLQSTSSARGDGKDEASPVDWRKIVEERIASKTRRFAKGQTSTTVAAAPNRFHAVAGHFFFPLVQHYDRPVVTFDLLGDDRLVLGRLVHTLGILMHLALHATIASQMGKALLEFIWVLRFHTDPFVRQGLLFGVSTILLSVPWQCLMADVCEEVLEMKCWLSDVAESDADEDCRRLAVSGLLLMEKLQSNLPPSPNQ